MSWRSGRSGMSRDWDGEPIATNYNRADAKDSKTHTVRMGVRQKKDNHTAGEASGGSSKDE